MNMTFVMGSVYSGLALMIIVIAVVLYIVSRNKFSSERDDHFQSSASVQVSNQPQA